MVALTECSQGAVLLHNEFRRFTNNSTKLRKIYSETLRSLDDISSSGVVPKEALKMLETKIKDVQLQRPLVGRPPCIIVLGQSVKVKAILVNELFSQTHLPLMEPDQSAWRMVKFRYGKKPQVLLTLGSSYELVENVQDTHWRAPRQRIRKVDLAVPDVEAKGNVDECAVVEMQLEHPILCDNAQVVVPPTGNLENFQQILKTTLDSVTPIVMYGISEDKLSPEDELQLLILRCQAPTIPIFFVQTPSSEETSGLTEADCNEMMKHGQLNFTSENDSVSKNPNAQNCASIVDQLVPLGFLHETKTLLLRPSNRHHHHHHAHAANCGENSTPSIPHDKEGFWLQTTETYKPACVTSEYISCLDDLPVKLVEFVRHYLESHLISLSNHLHGVHNSCLQMFILAAFEMAREMQITPKRLEYARMKESELFESLMQIAEKKQDEMCTLIADTIAERREDILQKAEGHQFKGPILREWEGPLSGKLVSQCMQEIRELVVLDLNNIVAQKLIKSVYCLHDTFLGTLERCVNSLEKNLESEDDGGLASVALKQILTSAYQVEVPNHQSSSILRGLYEKMRQLLSSLPWSSVPAIDAAWRRSVATDMLNSLCQKRLAKAVCSQLRDKLKTSHETFAAALKNLEMHHNERLERTGEKGFRLRKVHAPRLARLALETSSIVDFLKFGMPHCGKEVGRGQYGVVYACEKWATFSPCAIKSVVPMDDKHWNDLAMEFYYMRSIPEHDRIVRVRGSVIDHSYAGGSIPAVLIVMDRLSRDLYCALKVGLPWLSRLQVALDVVEGIRFLHSQGLVHRDIKLKNILLDSNNRAKLTDLGFCKPEAMMSGSIVGTPIHMAPELFSGQYDNSVDVYAFGILFWYLCSGKVRLPHAFEQCQNKEHLWTSVRKGARPERLPYFDDECWRLMESCWAGESAQRPLLGVVEPKLKGIKKRFSKLWLDSQYQSAVHDPSTTDESVGVDSEQELEESSDYLNIEIPSQFKTDIETLRKQVPSSSSGNAAQAVTRSKGLVEEEVRTGEDDDDDTNGNNTGTRERYQRLTNPPIKEGRRFSKERERLYYNSN
ncbi:dual serine/threonine and tyrosine protein kinase [Folsomia candida]|uniref:Dual serine/threonine and tyrosine protein kinase n=1 Tax=Folsomia candida TaxID=158441 RepID=A0A226DLP2_FOLCA|nr:dual serine/threonine and tyrosine protein kinase [Folsomia candida]XP_035713181.1 dual serine/threonine and tyrosine protein kinase [Folsomia candida]OXA45764.1 Dual serine/threonine and tyrosine protein kinase [Folsomia candida]